MVESFISENDVLQLALGGPAQGPDSVAEDELREWVPAARILEEQEDPMMEAGVREKMRSAGHFNLAGMMPCIAEGAGRRAMTAPAFLL